MKYFIYAGLAVMVVWAVIYLIGHVRGQLKGKCGACSGSCGGCSCADQSGSCGGQKK